MKYIKVISAFKEEDPVWNKKQFVEGVRLLDGGGANWSYS